MKDFGPSCGTALPVIKGPRGEMERNTRSRHAAAISEASRFLAVDLFAGCGGLTLGLKQAGFKVIGAVDSDKLATLTYTRNHRSTIYWHQDIRSMDALAMRKKLGIRRGRLDLLAGCPPCQGFSTLRTLRGKRRVVDDRNELIFEFLRFIREFRPKVVMVENVPELARDSRIGKVVRSLRGMGYSCDIRILDAANYRVPQRRRRMVLLAGINGPVPFGQPTKKRLTVRDAIGRLTHPSRSSDALHNATANHTSDVKNLIRRVPKDGGSRQSLGKLAQLDCHRRCNGFSDVYGRMAWDEVSPTITSGCVNPSKGRFLHPRQNRVISLREAALLQTFPRTYFFSLARGKCAAAQMIGNALPPTFVRRHGWQIRRYLQLVREDTLVRGTEARHARG